VTYILHWVSSDVCPQSALPLQPDLLTFHAPQCRIIMHTRIEGYDLGWGHEFMLITRGNI
jgi:hypothetical protein